MNLIKQNLNSAIFNFAKEENDILVSKYRKGIFDIPELAFVYLIGKKIAGDFSKYLDSSDYLWMKEINLKNGGPTDLAFINKNRSLNSYAIEFKMDNTWMKYSDDIKKLKKLKEKHFLKFFCGLKWVNDINQSNEFLNILYEKFGNNVELLFQNTFRTIVGKRKNELCLYTFWEIK